VIHGQVIKLGYRIIAIIHRSFRRQVVLPCEHFARMVESIETQFFCVDGPILALTWFRLKISTGQFEGFYCASLKDKVILV